MQLMAPPRIDRIARPARRRRVMPRCPRCGGLRQPLPRRLRRQLGVGWWWSKCGCCKTCGSCAADGEPTQLRVSYDETKWTRIDEGGCLDCDNPRYECGDDPEVTALWSGDLYWDAASNSWIADVPADGELLNKDTGFSDSSVGSGSANGKAYVAPDPKLFRYCDGQFWVLWLTFRCYPDCTFADMALQFERACDGNGPAGTYSLNLSATEPFSQEDRDHDVQCDVPDSVTVSEVTS